MIPVSTKLTPSEREVLALLATYGQGSWRDLLAFFAGSRASLARSLSELEKKGLIKKIELPRKRIYYEVTEQGKQVVEETEKGRSLTIRILREAFRQFIIRNLTEDAGKLLKKGKAEEAEKVILQAFGGLFFTAFIAAHRLSKNDEKTMERRLREVIRVLQPAVWTASWVLFDLAKKYPDIFEKIADKYVEQFIEQYL
jgi:DNA-binding MarR family transcriptional regulator